jgi:hypothetical protein
MYYANEGIIKEYTGDSDAATVLPDGLPYLQENGDVPFRRSTIMNAVG